MFERLDSRPDVLTQVLEAVHLGAALSSRLELRAPWALRYGRETGHRAGFHVVAEGRCWITVDGAASPVALAPGDLVLLPHGAAHVLANDPATPALEVATLVGDLPPGGTIALPSGGGEAAILLCGSYAFSADGANPLLRGLPDLLHVRADPTRAAPLQAAIRLLADEAGAAASGTALVVDRLVDLLFVYTLRAWLIDQPPAARASWFGALQDPVVGPAVRAVHAAPAEPWTVEDLARRAGLSRAAFARRFQSAVGEPPLAYVARWRMTIAADLLDRGERIAKVAHQVGYGNEYAFAKAFKRLRGVAPGAHRRRARGPA